MASKSEKTEKATPQRRRKAREDGQIARSAEVSVLVGLGTGVLVMRVFLPTSVNGFVADVRGLLATLDPNAPLNALTGRDLMWSSAALLAPFLGAAVVGALVAGFAQTRFNFSIKAAKPKLSHLDPRKGIKKFAPKAASWELLRTAFKVGLLIAVAWEPMKRIAGRLATGLGVDAAIGVLMDEAWIVLMRGLVLAFVLAAADYTFNLRKHENELKMAKHEVKQEHKNSEGDPAIKGERRRRAAELSRNRMLASVARADVVLVNPTDFAIALKYDPDEPAPRVLAKGADHLAAKIRKEAARNGVPIHADIPLCRALYRQVKVGDLVPPALFDAIAVVLVWAYRRTGRMPTSAGTPGNAPVGRRPAMVGVR